MEGSGIIVTNTENVWQIILENVTLTGGRGGETTWQLPYSVKK